MITRKTNILLLLCVILFSSTLLNCTSKDDSPPFHHYPMKLCVKDKSGSDRVHGIDYIENNDNAQVNIYEIKDKEYDLTVVQTGKSKENLSAGPLYIQLGDPSDYLLLTTSSFPGYRPAQLTHKLTCPHIFGDKDEHVIISNWEKIGTVNLCTSVIVDGVTYSEVERDSIDGVSIVFISLDY